MKRTLVAVALMAVITAACGGGNNSPAMKTDGSTGTTGMNMGGSTATTNSGAAGTRTVEIKMVDIGYQPNTLSVKRGERIDFTFQNDGKIPHDAFIGDTAAQADHEKEMRTSAQSSTSAGAHMGEGDMMGITVQPGMTGRLSYTFDKTGAIEIGCHEAGHYAAGMRVAVTVA